MSDIFVSYASEDRYRIIPVVRALEATGWSVFWDRTIPVGETWQKIIGTEIEACRCMVVIWSAASINKDWVYEEASEGKRRGVLAPVLIDDIIPPIGFRSIQAAKLEGWDGKAVSAEFDRLVTDISRMLGTPPLKGEAVKREAELKDTAEAIHLEKEYDEAGLEHLVQEYKKVKKQSDEISRDLADLSRQYTDKKERS